MPSFKQVTEAAWKEGFYLPAAWLPISWEDVAKRLNVTFGEYVDPDLGLAKYVRCVTDDGVQFGIEHLTQAPTSIGKPYNRILIECKSHPSDGVGDVFWREELDAVLAATGIKESELEWISDGCRPKV
jgi:hypothetical protein